MMSEEVRKRTIKAAIIKYFGTQGAFAQVVGTFDSVVSRVVTGKDRLHKDKARVWAKELHLPIKLFV